MTKERLDEIENDANNFVIDAYSFTEFRELLRLAKIGLEQEEEKQSEYGLKDI